MPSRVVLGVAAALAGACGASSPSDSPSPPCAGPAVIRDATELAPIASCQELRGDLVLRGGAFEHGAPLAVETVTGSVRLGPTLALRSIDFLPELREITGSLVIDSNLSCDGVFLLALQRVGGDVQITGNTAISGVNAPRLIEVGGSLTIADNPSLARVDLSALRRITGDLRVTRNVALDDLVLPAAMREEDGGP